MEAETVDYSNTANMLCRFPVYTHSRSYLGSWSSYGCIIVRGDDVNKGGSPTTRSNMSMRVSSSMIA